MCSYTIHDLEIEPTVVVSKRLVNVLLNLYLFMQNQLSAKCDHLTEDIYFSLLIPLSIIDFAKSMN